MADLRQVLLARKASLAAVQTVKSIPASRSALEKLAVDASILASNELHHDLKRVVERELSRAVATHLEAHLPDLVKEALTAPGHVAGAAAQDCDDGAAAPPPAA